MGRQHLDQQAVPQVALHGHGGGLDDAEPGQAGGGVCVAVVDGNGTRHGDVERCLAVGLGHFKTDRFGTQVGRVVHQLVVGQVVQRAGGAVRLQVGGAGAVGHAHGVHGPGDQACVHHRPGAQHTVETFAHQIHPAIGAADFQRQQRVQLQQLGQAGNHHITRHTPRHVEPHAPPQGFAAGLLEHGLQLVGIGQQVFAALVKRLAVLRGGDTAGGAVQQPGAQRGLQLPHRIGHTGLGQTQRIRRLGEAGQLGHAGEDVHAVEGNHCSIMANN